MNRRYHTFIFALAGGLLTACASQAPSNGQVTETDTSPVVSVLRPDVATTATDQPMVELSMQQIMSDPDWLGRSPARAYWRNDSQGLMYTRKREGSALRDLWQMELTDVQADNNGKLVALEQMHSLRYPNAVFNQANTQAAWIYQDNVYWQPLPDGKVRQLSKDRQKRSDLQFLNDGRLAYRSKNALFAIDLQSGLHSQLASWKFAKVPTGVKPATDFVAREQHKLMAVVAKKRADKQARFAYQNQLRDVNPALVAKPFYLPEKQRTVEVSLSPDARYAIVVTSKDTPWRGEGDIMPNYVVDNGRIKAEKVRRRVADAKPQSHTLWLLDLQNGQQNNLSYSSLPGYNDDVLAEVKRENAKVHGEDYQDNRLPRDIALIQDWYWSQSPIQWYQDGQQVAVMLEAWDNKDRWLATVDLSKAKLVSQHRLHDDAWINYKFNSFGWLHHNPTLYFLSEQSGYAHLYLQPPGGKARQLTQGRFEVDDLTLTRDDKYFYYRANQKHPGIYEIYRVALASGKIEALTELNGNTRYQLSPDEQKLLLTHSKVNLPPELYVQAAQPTAEVARLTHTVSDAFLSLDWVVPEIVAVPSSHGEQPIYSRVYLPENYQQGDARKAVIFNHGAGYLQNAHLGWSNYFREFMFHSLLVKQGYVVMDMDYRASQGYGRDWRTAIYRQMGTPEVQDLADGVNWLVENANVDRQRVGTYGGSYGGFMTFMALFTQPDLFQAGAALRPVTDWAHYNTGYTANILNTPEVDPIAYRRSSPIYHAEGLSKPLLINAPMVDDNVFFVDVVRLVQRLIELEKQEFETAIYPVEPHGFVQPSSWLDEYRRIYKLFEDNL